MVYSKGPWRDSGCRMETQTRKLKDGNILIVHGDADEPEPIIAEVWPKGDNARIITAAPEMYEICESFIKVCTGRHFRGGPEPMVCEELNFLLGQAKSVVAKIQGKEA